ncbi:hypothetical protein DSO57_1037464 [Entomophthora muscae]|uniref:Uncharacterized protein n=1 Tax=Entomophthora muscae TaxID=34485 RepID=A0ACC2S0W7_9FUNG|nr:hypothetical protein DSO57_1037464 [Entomophthora muscae]
MPNHQFHKFISTVAEQSDSPYLDKSPKDHYTFPPSHPDQSMTTNLSTADAAKPDINARKLTLHLSNQQ